MNTKTVKQNQNRLLLWQITRGHRLLYLGAAMAMVIANIGLFIPPLLAKYAIDALSGAGIESVPMPLRTLSNWLTDSNTLDLTILLYIAAGLSVLVTIFAGAFQYLRGRLTALASEGIAEELRLNLYARLHASRASFFDRVQTGDLVQRCSSDVDTVRVFLASNIVDISRSVVLLICVLPILFWINVELAWISIALMPLISLGSYLFFKRVKRLFKDTEEAESKMTACLQENLTGIRVVQAFNRQAFETEKFAHCIDNYRRCNVRVMTLMSYFWSLSDLICFSQIGLVLIIGAAKVQSAQLSLGDLFAFSAYVTMVVWPIRHLGRVLVDSGMAIVALGRIGFILDQSVEPDGITPSSSIQQMAQQTNDAEQPSKGSVLLSICNMSFTYPSARDKTPKQAMRNISLDIKVGETVAFVGAPGAGKSTLVALLLKLYDYQSGSIKLNGQELNTLDRHWVRKQFSVVSQEPFLYSRSIEGNLAMGDAEADLSKLQQACVDASLHESITNFENGYATVIGERGVTLSGGQRQRMAIARALLKNAPILVLDDALSAVDSQTEQHILKALQRRSTNQTTLIVAHRLSSFRHADRIVVFEDGAIVQVGTHEELRLRDGIYKRLCAIQGELDGAIQNELQSLKQPSKLPT